MSIDPALLRDSVALAASREPVITRRFYEVLFARYPQVRPLFSHNAPERQQQMLQGALLAVLDHLEDPHWLSSTLGALGATHKSYGVTDDMYPMVGECLIATLAELCGDQWTPAHEASWVEAYGVITSLALAGAAQVRCAS
ncbi:MAG: globin domain-containing protein [Myxococcota bacterium]